MNEWVVADNSNGGIQFAGCCILCFDFTFSWKRSCGEHSSHSVLIHCKWWSKKPFLVSVNLFLFFILWNHFQVISVVILFTRCTAIDPSDRTAMKRKGKRNSQTVLTQLMVRFLKRIESKIMKRCIRRKYLNPSITANIQFEPLVPFQLVENGQAISPELNEKADISFCSLCDIEVKFWILIWNNYGNENIFFLG